MGFWYADIKLLFHSVLCVRAKKCWLQQSWTSKVSLINFGWIKKYEYLWYIHFFRAKMIVGSITSVGCVLFAPTFWIFGTDGSSKCGQFEREDLRYWGKIFYVFDACVTFVLPFTMIALLNAFIARAIWKSNKERRNLTISTASTESCFGRSLRSTKMLLLVSTVFLCFSLPFYSMKLYNVLFVVNWNYFLFHSSWFFFLVITLYSVYWLF